MIASENIRKVVPYVPGEQPTGEVIKLNTNENPYPPCPGVEKVLKSMEIDVLRLYPDVNGGQLRTELARMNGLTEEEVFVGVGSDDVLAMAFMTFFNSGSPILFPDITYSFYDVWADLFGIPYRTVALDENLCIRTEDYLPCESVGNEDVDKSGGYPDSCQCGGIVIPNPNAPTGVEKSVKELERIVAANSDKLVIIDEAYVDFGAVSMVPMVHKYDNLLVVQTFSKSRSMAGARIGMAYGDASLIKYLNDVKFSFNSYTMNRMSVAAGVASLLDEAYFRQQVDRIIATRERVKGELKEIGFSFPDSKSNFVFATHKSVSAEDIYKACKEKNIYLRYFKKPRIDNYLRITIGTDEQMDALISFLKGYLN